MSLGSRLAVPIGIRFIWGRKWTTDLASQIIPSFSKGHDTVNFRHMKESNSLHLEDQIQGAGGLTTVPTTGIDDGLDSDGPDLFGAFSSVTLHYDGET